MKELEQRAQRFLPLTETTFCILAALAAPRHGYAVMQLVEEASRGRLRIGPGTLYGALTTLVRQGLIERTGEAEEGGERRKLYVLTELGRAVADAEGRRLVEMVVVGRELLAVRGGLREE
jgi:DNA-binding PadR family transcriptional regulator